MEDDLVTVPARNTDLPTARCRNTEKVVKRFTVEFHSADESLWYDLFAFSRPNTAARIAYPLARSLQRRFAADSKLGMKRAVEMALSFACCS